MSTEMERLMREIVSLKSHLAFYDNAASIWAAIDERREKLQEMDEGKRCHITGNPCGTDTVTEEKPCQCWPCQVAVRDRTIRELREALEVYASEEHWNKHSFDGDPQDPWDWWQPDEPPNGPNGYDLAQAALARLAEQDGGQ